MILDYVIWSNTLGDYLKFAIIVFIGIVVSKLLELGSGSFFKMLAAKTKTKFDDILVNIMHKPLPFMAVIIVIFINAGLKTLNTSEGFQAVFKDLSFIAYAFCGAWFLIKFVVAIIDEYITKFAARTNSKMDDQMIPLLKTLTKIIILFLAVIITLHYFGYNITAWVAGLGIGGIAIAYAAKDILENFLSGIVIFSEKPFHIGDFVKSGDAEGDVEEIGIRSTKLRATDGTLIVVPNSKITMQHLENRTKSVARREVVTLGLTYDMNADKLELAKKAVKEILSKEKDVRNDFDIYFDKFDDYSQNIVVRYWITKVSFSEYVIVKDKINFEIKKRFEKEKIEFAFPTQTIFIKK